VASLLIQTAQISREVAWGDPRNIDISVKSAKGAVLAPTWKIVGGIKRTLNPDEPKWAKHEAITWPQYIEAYLQLLRGRCAEDPAPFMELIALGEVTLYCYCPEDSVCHRHLAARVLHGIAARKGYTVTIVPEYLEGSTQL
jgi:uncharacterized protein YeaO (DUF488 family)